MAETPKNDSDLLRMQQEAIRRVRLMQQRAQQSVEPEVAAGSLSHREPTAASPQKETAVSGRPRSPSEPSRRTPAAHGSSANSRAPQNARPGAAQAHPRYAARPQQNPLAALFSRPSRGVKEGDSLLSSLLDGDSERTMLIVLLMILIDDQTDMTLILALLYLIL